MGDERRRKRHIFRITTAQGYVVIMCACFMLTSLLALCGYMSWSLYRQAYEATAERMRVYNDKTLENIEQSFSFVSNTTMAVAATDIILRWIDNPSLFSESDPDYYTNLSELRAQSRHILTYSNAWKDKFISYISIYVNDRLLTYTYAKPLPEGEIIRSSNQAYQYLKDSQSDFIVNVRPLTGDNRIFHIRAMKQDFRKNDSLVIVVATDEEVIRRQYVSNLDPVMVSYLIDDAGYVFSSSEQNMRGLKCDAAIASGIRDGQTTVQLNGEAHLLIAKPMEDIGLTFATLVPVGYIAHQALNRLPVLIVICLALGLALIAAGVLVSYRSTRFIRDLAHGMERVAQKDYDVKMRHYRNYAIDFLSDSFNNMTGSMKRLMRDTYESKIMLQEMQLEFLQQQVNPHFLFNILLTIQIKAKMSGAEAVYDMLVSLSGYLRAGLYASNNTFTTLGEELMCVRFYLHLQSQRLGTRLAYDIDVPEALLKVQIPRLSIEPLVENAVVHGAESSEKPVRLSISAQEGPSDLTIVVSDDGVGFDLGSLDLTNEISAGLPARDKIGLKNTNSRMKLLYGDGYALRIDTEPGVGTRITVRVPRTEESACTKS